MYESNFMIYIECVAIILPRGFMQSKHIQKFNISLFGLNFRNISVFHEKNAVRL